MEGAERESLSLLWYRAGITCVHPSFLCPPVQDKPPLSLVSGRDSYMEQIHVPVSKLQPSPQHNPCGGQEDKTSALLWPVSDQRSWGVFDFLPSYSGLNDAP